MCVHTYINIIIFVSQKNAKRIKKKKIKTKIIQTIFFQKKKKKNLRNSSLGPA